MLIGEKVILRRIEKPDLWQLWKWHEENALYLFSRLKPFISWDEVNESFMKYFSWKGDFLIEDKRGKALGVCSYQDINWKNRSCELALQVYESRRTLALDAITVMLTFLFNELNTSRVNSSVQESASVEIEVFEKAGFILEGRLREHVFRDQGYVDLLIFVLFKEDFVASSM